MKANKLYKYRPLSEFLFKELRYSELYFASYVELNDPLDLSVRINFKPVDKKMGSSLLLTHGRDKKMGSSLLLTHGR